MRWPWGKKAAKDRPEELPLLEGPSGCLATKRAIQDGCGIYYMYRTKPCNDMDSGWIFAHGSEDDDYINDPSNSSVYDIATVAGLRPEIAPHLHEPVGAAFYWDKTRFVPDPLGSPDNPPVIH